METIIRVENVCKSFRLEVQETQILKDISFTVEKNDFLIIFGPSGCGKSTLLHTMLGLEPPTSGDVYILEQNLYRDRTKEDERSDFRKRHIGMVYQQANWIRSLSVMENVAFPLTLLGTNKLDSARKAWEMLAKVSMQNWINHKPTELSGGQQQRVALARALINDPELIVADEPTGNLDYESGQELMQMLVDLSNQGKTIVMVTHDLEYLRYCKTAVRIFDGKVVGIYKGEEKDNLLKGEIQTKRGSDELNSLVHQG